MGYAGTVILLYTKYLVEQQDERHHDNGTNNTRGVLEKRTLLTAMSALLSIPQTELSIDDAIERLGYGRFQIRVLIAAGLCFAADAMEVLMLSFLAVVLQATWNLTSQQTALLTSIVFLGQFMGTLTLGPLGDKIGRRPVFLLAAVIIAIFGVATAFCNSFIALVLVRMIVGFGVGGLLVPFDILAELVPMENRGQDLVFIEYFWTFGTLLVPLLAFLTIGNETNDVHDNQNGWRYFVALCALPSFLSAIIGTCLVPESPRWLLTTGRGEEAMEILRNGAASNQKDPYTVFPEGMTLKHEIPEAASIMDLFDPVWRRVTIFLWITWACFAFLYYGTILSSTLIFSESPADTQTSDAYSFDYVAIFISGSAEVLGTTIAIFAIDRIGRIPLQALSFLTGGVSVMLLAILASLPDSPHAGLVTLAFIARMCMMSGTITTWVATAEILTTEIRTTGHSAANACARLGAFSAPYLVQASTPPLVIGSVMLVISIITTISVTRLPETKGRTLGLHPHHYNETSGHPNQASESAMT